VLAWLSVGSEVQTSIWPTWCHCHSLSLASVKSRLVLLFWYRLTWVVLEKGPLNGRVCVCLSKLTDFNNFWYTEHWENFTRRPYRLIFCPHLSDVATLPWEIKKVIFQHYSSYTSDYLRYFRRKQIATVVLQLLLFTYYCLVLPVISIAIILHLGHTKGGARVLIRTCCGLRQLLVATARGWISAQRGAPCDWSVSKKTGSMY